MINTGFQTGKEHQDTSGMVPQQADEDKGPCEPQSDLGEPLRCSIEQEDSMWIGRGEGWGVLSSPFLCGFGAFLQLSVPSRYHFFPHTCVQVATFCQGFLAVLGVFLLYSTTVSFSCRNPSVTVCC